MNRARNAVMVLGMAWLIAGQAPGLTIGPGAAEPNDLSELTLEQLMNVEVTSASRKEQKLSEAAAAVYVITQEDIRRSGVTTIADALRMVPGIIVARIDANQWAVTSRGFNNHYANKLQVLVDGRSIYNPLFAGVYWDSLNELLPDLDRIEVIRGPGAALWGANAVNGVINIITSHTSQTQGGLAVGAAGSELRALGAVRYGAAAGESFHYRVFGRYFQRDDSGPLLGTGEDANDDWYETRLGFRADRELSGGGSLMFQGGRFGSRLNQVVTEPILVAPFARVVDDVVHNQAAYLTGRWTRPTPSSGEMSLQVNLDALDRGQRWYHEQRMTYDLDFQHRARLGARQEIVWGLGYRRAQDDLDSSATITFEPGHRTDDLVSFFAQDEVSLAKDRVRVTFGTKIEHNDYSGFEVQPDARILWKASERVSVWAAASRAVRIPDRAESDVRANLAAFPTPGPPGLAAFLGNKDIEAEVLRSVEAGWRYRPLARFSLEVAAFSNSYTNLISGGAQVVSVETTPPPVHLLVATTVENGRRVGTRGVEVCANWQASASWGLVGWYSYFWLNTAADGTTEGNDPRQQAQVRSYVDLPRGFAFDTTVHFTGGLPQQGVGKYLTLDARVAWKASDKLELSLVGQDLLRSRHAEFNSSFAFVDATQVQRGVYGRATWRF